MGRATMLVVGTTNLRLLSQLWGTLWMLSYVPPTATIRPILKDIRMPINKLTLTPDPNDLSPIIYQIISYFLLIKICIFQIQAEVQKIHPMRKLSNGTDRLILIPNFISL